VSAFGDWEPEDSWDAGDDPDVQLDNLRRRVLLLYLGRMTPNTGLLTDIALAVIVARARDDLTARDMTRIADLFDDIAFVARRLEPDGG
jgi:hypothetical protein